MQDLPANRSRVLVMDDDHITARYLESALGRRGFAVAVLSCREEDAREETGRETPDLVVLDPGSDSAGEGAQVARFVCEEHGLLCLIVTSLSPEEFGERFPGLPCAGVIRKPFTADEIVARAEAAIETRRSRAGLESRLPVLEAAASQLDVPVFVTDLNGTIVFFNETAEKQTGWPRDEALGRLKDDVIRLEDEDTAPVWQSGPEDGEGRDRPVELVARGGSRTPVEERSAPILSEQGDAIGLVHVLPRRSTDGAPAGLRGPEPTARAATLKKVAAIAQDPAFQELIGKKRPGDTGTGQANPVTSAPAEDGPGVDGAPLVDELGDPLVNLSGDGIVSYANREAEACFGNGAKLSGRPFWSFFGEEAYRRHGQDFDRPLADGRRHRFEFRDGLRSKWYEVRLYRSRDGVLGLFHDITAAKRDAEEVVRQQRLEGLGLLARGFAHDFNNHLTTLTGNLTLAQERHTDDSDLQEMLKDALGAARRATGLVHQLMTFARGGRPVREAVRLPDLIRGLLLERRDLHPEIRYQFQGGSSEGSAQLDPAQLRRLLENLIQNAEEAMPGGGVLIVRCGRVEGADLRRLRGGAGCPDEPHVLVEVIDTGEGIDSRSIARVFEPYFTTRKENNASGIGLTVCESIAKAHGGFLQLQSKEGKGTIVTVCMPASDRSAPVSEEELVAARAATSSPARTSGEKARILILEDDAPIRRLMSATLTRSGYDVTETRDGRETVAAYENAREVGRDFDLVICDLTIENGLGGVDTMKRILEIDPAVVAIVSSGYSDAPAMANPAAFGFSAVLPKPYAPSELAALVDRMIGG